MPLLTTFLFPWLRFFQMGRPLLGGICLLLQLSLIGWPFAVLWSMRERNRYNVDRIVARALAGAASSSVKN